MSMILKKIFNNVAVSAVILFGLQSCTVGSHDPKTEQTITGVAATGAPVFGTVTLKDASIPAVERTKFTRGDGTFAFNTADIAAPFILRTSSGGKTLYSIATGSGITNINPLTTIVVGVAAGGADLNTLYASPSPLALNALLLNLTVAESAVKTALAPVLNKFSASGSIFNTVYVADHTGVDALFDVVNVTLSGGVITLTNKSTSKIIFTALATEISKGSVVMGNLPDVPVPSSGAKLYMSKCSVCHGDISTSSLIGRGTAVAINGAISSDFGGMSSLSNLSIAEIQAISEAISAQAPPPPPSNSTGAVLYTTNCSSCHGSLATSTKLGATVIRIQNAISANVGDMGRFASLTAAEIQAIVVALNPPQPPPPPTLDGTVLYATHCAGCHNPLATSTKKGLTITRFYNAVTANTTTGMGYLSALTVAEVSAIISVLPSAPPPPGTPIGQILYEANCAGCHGSFLSSTKAGPTMTAARIQTAITNNVGLMGALAATLTSSDIANIATELAKLPPPVVVQDGPSLYAAYCASCHNPLATTTKGGATAAKISAAIASNRGSMGSLSTLTQTQISLIETALAQIAPPACGSCHNVVLRDLATGRHNTHATKPSGQDAAQFTAATSCGICHGSGYTTSSTGKLLSHNDGTKTITAITTTNARINGLLRWIPPVLSPTGSVIKNGSCSPACHGGENW